MNDMKPNKTPNIVIWTPENLKHNLLICLELYKPDFENSQYGT